MWRYLHPGDSVIDGGANAGLYTLFAAKLVGNSGRVGMPLRQLRLQSNASERR